MERRDLFRILPAAALAGSVVGAEQSQGRVFSADEYAQVDCLTELILPADEDGPGASLSRVAFYIDRVLFYGEEGNRQRWREGLRLIDAQANARFGKAFLKLTKADQEKILFELAAAEEHPSSEAEKFFVVLKKMTIDGFFLSDVAEKDYFHYTGNAPIDEFPGCEKS